MKGSILAHDTYDRVFARLDPEQFWHGFLSWVQAVFEVSEGQVIAIDGKQPRRSHDKTLGKNAIRMVSAWERYSVMKSAYQLLLPHREAAEDGSGVRCREFGPDFDFFGQGQRPRSTPHLVNPNRRPFLQHG